MSKRYILLIPSIAIIFALFLGAFALIYEQVEIKRQTGQIDITATGILPGTYTEPVTTGEGTADITTEKDLEETTLTPSGYFIEGGSITETLPEGEFIFPIRSSVLSNDIRIKFELKGAERVEFYLRRVESASETYLGQGRSIDKIIWTYAWKTNSIPNGQYYLLSRSHNEYGSYKSGHIYVAVNNKIEEERAAVEEIEKQIEETTIALENEDRLLTAEEEKIKENILTEVQGLEYEATNIVINQEEVKLDIQKKIDILSQEVKAGQNKEELTQGISSITDIVSGAMGEEKEEEIARLRERKQKKIESLIDELNRVFEKKERVMTERERLLARDSDDDGLPDHEELRLGTNPANSDSDNDGFLDGTEVVLGYDPLNPSPADRIKYQDPRLETREISESFRVDRVELIQSEERPMEKVLRIQGKAPPHSFVTIYIYTDPIVVVTKTDGKGNWEYILDKPLADGQHTVYATVTNNKGEIEKSSESFQFAKTAEGVVRLFESKEDPIASPVESLQRSFMILILSTIVFSLGIALFMVGFFIKTKNE